MEYPFCSTIASSEMWSGIPIPDLKIAKLKLYYEILVP